MARFASFREFYPFYLEEHGNRTSRRLHFIGSWGALAFVIAAALTANAWCLAGGLVCGYALLGATWLMWKTADELHGDARRWALISGVLTALFLLGVSLSTLVVHPIVAERWGWTGAGFDLAHFLPLSVIPLLGLIGLAIVAIGVRRASHMWPFLGAVLVFLSGYAGLAAGFFPYVAPYTVDFRTAAAPDNALALMLVGTAVILPLILAYTGWVYWVFRGKVTPEAGYH